MANDKRMETINLQGKQYAQVSTRVKEFRGAFPNSKIEIGEPEQDGELMVFNAWIWKDKKDLIELMKSGVTDKNILRSSADANGAARSRVGVKEKDFEKLQTIAVGRALAMVGYLASGEIASFEEMEEFYQYQDDKKQKYIDEQVELFATAKNMDELKQLWLDTDKTIPAIVEAKNKRKAELEKVSSPKQVDAGPSPATKGAQAAKEEGKKTDDSKK